MILAHSATPTDIVVRSAPIDLGVPRMRRLALLFSTVLLVGAFAIGAPVALAGPTDWAVNGTPLAAGQEVSVKFATTAPVQLIAPDAGVDITCASWKAKGTLVGGETGTGELVKSKLAHCTEPFEGHAVTVKVQLTKVTLHTDLVRPAGTPESTEFELVGICFKKVHCEPTLQINGTVDTLGPSLGEPNLVDFPQPSLPATTLTIGGSPAELVTKAAFKLPKHATLTQVEP
jgi:hypothetical protein